ncbi:MAG: hypothetical protein IT358_03650 [Gemmatimonadaceae bacterium]|jgi:hypothetical protein|nr:hypothetical protein [Gemmatimonadota bacterium]MCC7322891.1 hypothetical protein [Gemmatimonadaceae bacterium]
MHRHSMRFLVALLFLIAELPSAAAAQQHPVYDEIAPWNGAVLESAEITYRGTTATMIGRQPRLVATGRCCLLIREYLKFDRPIPNLLPTEGEMVIGLSRAGSRVMVTIRLHGTSFCVNHGSLWRERDGTLKGRVKAVLPNENFFLQSQLRFDGTEQKGRWDLVTGDGTLNIRFVFRAGRPEDGPLPLYLTAREARSIRQRNRREVEPHCAE